MKNKLKLAFLYLLIIMAAACEEENNKNDKLLEEAVLDEKPSSEKMVLYQIMTRLFGNTNKTNIKYGTIEENGVGKFNDINVKSLQELKKLGITHVWYTGIIEHAVIRDYTQYDIKLDDADVVKGRAGSPYAIKDYYDVNPDLAENVEQRMQEFEALLARTHEQGLKVIIDFIPNHVARQYHSDAKPIGTKDLGEDDDTSLAFTPNNNFYYLPGEAFQVPDAYVPLGEHTFSTKDGKFEEIPAKATGNDKFTASPSVDDWFETVKLNYGVDYENDRKTYFDPVPDTWLKMTEILKYWAAKGVDGFRCDMAEMVPVEFWDYTVKEVKSEFPEIVFIAEIYNPDAYGNYINIGGFDFLYDKVQLYDTLKHVMQGTGSTANLPAIWQDLKGQNKHMLRFLENHDEQRIASEDFAGDAKKAIPAMIVSAAWYSGPIMIYFGQEVGEPGKGEEGFGGEDGRTTIFDYWGVPEHQKWVNNKEYDGGALSKEQIELRAFYGQLLNLSANSKAIAKGKLIDLHNFTKEDGNTAQKTYAFLRSVADEHLLFLTNFDHSTEKEIVIQLPGTLSKTLGASKFTISPLLGKPLSIDNTEIKAGEKLEVNLPPLAGNIYRLKVK